MFSIIVQRGAGAYQGDDIVEPLIKEVPAALERGRNELDERAHGLQDADLEIVFQEGLRCGQQVAIQEALFGKTIYGKITGISLTFDGQTPVARLKLQIPTDFKL